MSMYDSAREIYDKAVEASSKLDRVISALSQVSKNDEPEYIMDTISEAISDLSSINSDIY